VLQIQPWAKCGRAGAIDSTVLQANGGVWHKKDREKGEVPHKSIDTEAHWTKSGWHGWVYGWKLHVVSAVAAVWIPLAADLTPANVADNEVAPPLIWELPSEMRYLLGDLHYNAPNIRKECNKADRILVTTQYITLIRIPMAVRKCVVSSTNCVLWLLRTSMSISKVSLMVMDKCLQRAWSTPAVLLWVPFSSTNLLCCSVSNLALISILA